MGNLDSRPNRSAHKALSQRRKSNQKPTVSSQFKLEQIERESEKLWGEISNKMEDSENVIDIESYRSKFRDIERELSEVPTGNNKKLAARRRIIAKSLQFQAVSIDNESLYRHYENVMKRIQRENRALSERIDSTPREELKRTRSRIEQDLSKHRRLLRKMNKTNNDIIENKRRSIANGIDDMSKRMIDEENAYEIEKIARESIAMFDESDEDFDRIERELIALKQRLMSIRESDSDRIDRMKSETLKIVDECAVVARMFRENAKIWTEVAESSDENLEENFDMYQELFTRLLLKLDNVEVGDDKELRSVRRSSIKRVKKSIDDMNRKMEQIRARGAQGHRHQKLIQDIVDYYTRLKTTLNDSKVDDIGNNHVYDEILKQLETNHNENQQKIDELLCDLFENGNSKNLHFAPSQL